MHNLKIQKLLDDESIAMILKEMQENTQFEDTLMIRGHVDCTE